LAFYGGAIVHPFGAKTYCESFADRMTFREFFVFSKLFGEQLQEPATTVPGLSGLFTYCAIVD
jgi:hypothetical protein